MSEIWVWNNNSCPASSGNCFKGFSGYSPEKSSSFQLWNCTTITDSNERNVQITNSSFSLGTREGDYGDYCADIMVQIGHNGTVVHAKDFVNVHFTETSPLQSMANLYALSSTNPGIGLLGMNQRYCRYLKSNPAMSLSQGVEHLAPNLIQSLLNDA